MATRIFPPAHRVRSKRSNELWERTDGLDFLAPSLGILIVLVSVIGVTTVFTMRLGGIPFVETLARELKGVGGGGGKELYLKVQDLTD